MVDAFALVLTGITTAFLAAFVYKTTDHGFQMGGRYRSKQDALWIYLGTILGLGLINPIVYGFWSSFSSSVSFTLLLGLAIAGGMFMVNETVTHWKHTDQKSLTIYLISIALILVF